MEISIGEYVRTDKGIITKAQEHFIDGLLNGKSAFGKAVKHSKNIIDLIEEGDYVNGCQVMGIYVPRDTWEPIQINVDSQTIKYFIQDEIKTIVTKEMFASAEYRVETD